MLYLNQLEYHHIPYNHNMDNGGVPEERRSVATSGCGLCSLCMIVDHLTVFYLDIEECVKLAEEHGANRKMGTDLRVLSPIVAEHFELDYFATNDRDELIEHLNNGGQAVANVGGDREGYAGLFSNGGHYVVVVSIDGDEVCILDPSYEPGKFDEESRAGKVREDAPFLYCSIDDLMKDTDNRDPGFYLFKRRKGE